jgi:uncharacterized protein YbjT (DUF2867 family)
MSHVLIIGGHGKVALRLEPLLVAAGDQVTALIRDPTQAQEVAGTGAPPRVVDVERLTARELAGVFDEQDAIVWSAGAGGGDPARTYAVDRDAAIRAIDAAEAAGVLRFVLVSYLGAGRNHGVDPSDGFYAYAQAKAAADEHLRASVLDWTILGPSALSLDPGTGRIRAVRHLPGGGFPPELPAGWRTRTTPREDVAAVVAACLREPATIRRTIDFTGGDTPIAQAIAQTA